MRLLHSTGWIVEGTESLHGIEQPASEAPGAACPFIYDSISRQCYAEASFLSADWGRN